VSKIYVGKSNIVGKGVFASQDIKRGEIVFIMKGDIVKLKIGSPSDTKIGPNRVGIGRDLWIDPYVPFVFINHSCNPNAGIKGRITFVALRNIKRDEEVTFDYSIQDDDIYWKMDCVCGEKSCRKKIRTIQFLPKDVIKKYLPYIPTYFKKMYVKY